MSVSPDPAELSAPRDPGSYGRARVMGPAFWAMIVFGLLCIVAGYVLASFGPRLFPARPRPAAEAVGLSSPAPVQPAAAVLTPADPEPALDAGTPSADLARLAERLETLEGQQTRAAQAAAGALAAAALMEAAQTSRPFPGELAALAAVAPPSADLRSLRSYAEQGAPSRAALAASFPDYAARAAAAARSPQEDAGLLARIGHALSRIVTLRRVGDVPGTGVDAVLAKAELQVEEGDIVAALNTLDGLPSAGKTALAPWRVRAERRADIDRRIAQVRALALEDLAGLARSGG
ncbi:hypothetical protein M9M90_20575 [Phenylobacterium sp. LH3H17]|uniref:COG4223 family protein n=1 Tax=Phenylobacterium sp. LH3H17 TaxID=2903901 RepID=UPI0020C9B882|nr:hypothetical protein [Phenylobacterium sp. LH3H17]UTP39567.1 hypothetical protein M9M90_20575 [Phenylobacterium sp. LH3H17]